MLVETDSVENATYHPDIDLFWYQPMLVRVTHLGWSIHKSCVLVEFIFIISKVTMWDFTKIYSLCSTWSKITKFELFVSEQNILNLKISVNDWRALLMQNLYASYNLSHNKDDLFLTKLCWFIFDHQIKQTTLLTQLHQNINMISIINLYNLFPKGFKQIRMVWNRSNILDFILGCLETVFTLANHSFQGKLFACSTVSNTINISIATWSNKIHFFELMATKKLLAEFRVSLILLLNSIIGLLRFQRVLEIF